MSLFINDMIAEVSAWSAVDHALFWLPPFLYTMGLVPVTKSVLATQEAKDAALKFRNAHNLILGGFSLVIFVWSIPYLFADGFSPYNMVCLEKKYDSLYVWAWYLSKFYEWVDSILLIAAGKELSSLHYNHHMSTVSLVGVHFVGRANRASIFDLALFMNAFVHSLMYFYYWSPTIFAPIKILITRLQIVQHVTAVSAICYTLFQKYNSSCSISVFGNSVSLGLYIMYLFQFMVFYIATYLSGNGKGKKDKKEKKGE